MDSSPAPGPLDALLLLHARPIASPSTCRANYVHDPVGMALSGAIVVGLLLSYLPAFARIVRHRNSAGYSPLFLLLGATSSASSLGNIVTLQWGQVACCQYLSAGQCFESVLGIAQVFVQWSCFLTLCVTTLMGPQRLPLTSSPPHFPTSLSSFFLYLAFYPLSSKYVQSVPISGTDLPSSHRHKRGVLSSLVPNFMRTTTPAGLIRDSLTDDDDDDTDVSDADTTDGGLPGGGRRGGFDPRRYILPGQLRRGEIILSSEYRHAVSLLLLTLLHLALTFLTTLILLVTLPKAETPHPGTPPAPWDPTHGGGSGAPQDGAGGGREHPSERAVRVWATTLGLVSVALGCAQYAPQLVHTARRKVVGSLSIPMMLLQTPGSFVFVYTLAIRPGVNFTGWATYFVTGVLQGTLLVLCLVFRRRQRRLGVDDWGNPLPEATRSEGEGEGADRGRGERRPLLG
ncbi:hypothetical protein Rhopal_001298-T1 [Rhodotorula paludigena]|uniref:Uncharacterized protein n=1 Tax=Rhodotorula paludigena TaxID=86838 RepID=A0AAV5GDY1_9BASI|nr:hypothetical protein Rhopal_001298-T1 [Rhodotorula paludigena]